MRYHAQKDLNKSITYSVTNDILMTEKYNL